MNKPECAVCTLGRASLPAECPFREQTLAPGAVLLRQGETATAVWYVKRGVVVLSSLNASGSETSCALRGAGTLLGLEAASGRASDHEAWAIDEVVACRIPVATFAGWLGEQQTPANAVLMLTLDERARLHDERIAVSGSAVARVAHFLLARQRLHGDGVGGLGVAHQLLARMLGMSPETLSRALKRMRAAGALDDARQIVVRDGERLQELAGELE